MNLCDHLKDFFSERDIRLDSVTPFLKHRRTFTVVRAEDGRAFIIKLYPETENGVRLAERVAARLDGLKGCFAVGRLFPEVFSGFPGFRIICMDRSTGESRFPDELSDEEWRCFLQDYLRFSLLLQKLPDVPCSAAGENGEGRNLVIHGDFNPYNFHFESGRLSAVFDLDEIRRGHPTVDILRYLTCSYGHLKVVQWCRRRRLLKRLEEAVGLLPYGGPDWLESLGELRRQSERIHGGRKRRLFDAFARVLEKRRSILSTENGDRIK